VISSAGCGALSVRDCPASRQLRWSAKVSGRRGQEAAEQVPAADLAAVFSVSPTNPTVTTGQTFTLTASWTGLDPARPYLGYVEYPGGDGSFVEINN